MSLETEVGVFIDGVLNYFSTSVQQGALCGTPHLALSEKPELADYTGVIQVSGKRRAHEARHRNRHSSEE